MLGVRGVAPPSTPPVVPKRASITRNPIFSSLLFLKETHKENLSLFPLPNHTQLFPGRNGFRLFAQKKQQDSSLGSIELERKADFVEDEGFDFDEFEDEEGDEEEDDLMLPLEKMDAWLKNRPRGFGEGKVYDTSIEDKLMEEIEQSRKAQLDNINKLKKESLEAKSQRDLIAPGVVSNEIRVGINNLPKKKNVLRDLKSAFQGVQGLISISPVVSGNKKTRDPVCKGFGFVSFKSLEDANRFVQNFSGQSIAFGKIQKQIKCEILKPRTGDSKGSVQHEHISVAEPRLTALEDELDHDPDTEPNDPILQFWEDDYVDEFDEDLDDDDFGLPRASDQGSDDGMESELEPDFDLSSLRQIKRTKGEKKKSMTNRKSDKILQPSNPGSAMRLKVREEAELSDVFSRFEMKEALASKEISMASEDEDDQDSDIEENLLQFLVDDDFDEDLDDFDDAKIIELERASKTESNARKSGVKQKPENIPKLSIQALAKMLKIQDIAKLEELVSRLKAVKDRSSPNTNIEDNLVQFLENEDFDEFDGDDFKFIREFKQASNHTIKSNTKAEAEAEASDSSSSPKQKEKKAKATGKRSVVKDKASKIPKLKIPGSAAKRLKGLEKAKLADVFTKYGTKEALSSKDM